jgi:hypothetical protein
LFAAYTIGGQTSHDIIKSLRNALRDARTKPILEIETAALTTDRNAE